MKQGSYKLDKLFPNDLKGNLLTEIERLYFAAKADSKNIRECLRKLEFHGNKRILDVGCGPGNSTIIMSDYNPEGYITGLDREYEFIDYAKMFFNKKNINNVSFIQGNSDSVPFKDGLFDICFSRYLFQHLPEPSTTFKELIRVTRKGGKIGIYDMDFGLRIFYPEPRHFREFLDATNKLRRFSGGDIYIGRKLYNMFPTHKLKNIESIPLFLDSTYPGKEVLNKITFWKEAIYTFEEYYNKSHPFVEMNLMNIQNLLEYAEDLRLLFNNPNSYISFGGYFVCGVKI